MYRFAPWTLAAACTMAPGEPEVYSSDTGGPMESSLHTGADSGNSCADTWLDPDFVVVDGVVRPDPDVYPGMRLVLSYDIVGDRAVITLHAIRGTQQVGLGFTGDPYAHSGKFVQVLDASDQVLYTESEYYLIEESVEALGSGGGFENHEFCPDDGFINLRDYPNLPEAAYLLLLQERIDGEETFGPIQPVARIPL